MPEKYEATVKRWAELGRNAAWLSLLVGGMLITVSTVVWRSYGSEYIASLGIATTDDLDTSIQPVLHAVQMNAESIEKLRLLVLKATGDDKPVKMIEGRSYVIAPVYADDQYLTLRLVVQKTEGFPSCEFTGAVAMFQDRNSAIRSSPNDVAPTRQIPIIPTSLDIKITMPEGLVPGNVLIWLEMRHICEGKSVFSNTVPIQFILLTAEERSDPPAALPTK